MATDTPNAADIEAQFDRPVELRAYADTLWRYRWLVLPLFLFVVIGRAGLLELETPIYQAEARVRIEAPRGLTERAKELLPEAPEVDTEVLLVQSSRVRERAEELSRADGVDTSVAEIGAMMTADAIGDTNVIRIRTRHPSAERAQVIANAVANGFIEESTLRSKSSATRAREQIEVQLESTRRELEMVDQEVAAFVAAAGLNGTSDGLQPASDNLLGAELAEYEAVTELKAKRATLSAVQEQLDEENTRLTSSERTVRNDELVATLQSELLAKQQELDQAKRVYTRKYPGKILRLEAEISELQARLAREIDGATGQHGGALDTQKRLQAQVAALESEVASLEAKHGAAGDRRARLEHECEGLQDRRGELAELVRRQSLAEGIHAMLAQRRQEALINEAQQLGGTEMVDHAVLATTPVSPNKMLNMVLAVIFGLLLAVGVPLLLDYLDDTIHNPGEMEALLHLPTLGVVPEISGEGTPLLDPADTKSAAAECYRTIRSNLAFARAAGQPQTLAVTSAGVGEGKSLTTANLAIVMSLAGQRVLIVDGDMRRPSLHRMFGLGRPEQGLSHALVGMAKWQDLVMATGVENVFLLPVGVLPPNPAELIDTDAMGTILAEAGEAYDVVIADTPPGLPVTDAVLLAKKADAAIVVLKYHKSRRSEAQEFLNTLRRASASPVGTVLNRLSPGGRGYYYYYYYYDYRYAGGSDAEDGEGRRRGRKRRH